MQLPLPAQHPQTPEPSISSVAPTLSVCAVVAFVGGMTQNMHTCPDALLLQVYGGVVYMDFNQAHMQVNN